MIERGYGILLFIGLMAGVVIGLAVGEPSAGAVIGIGSGALAGLALSILRRGS
jgi:hypothetical protein